MSYFSRVTMNTGHMNAQKLAKVLCTDAYREHQSLWRLFTNDPQAERDFLFRREQANNTLRYFVVSDRAPQDNEGLWDVDQKNYEPKLRNGHKLAFTLRVNPVVTRKGENGKGKRHDVVMDAKLRMGYKGMLTTKREPMVKIIHDAGMEWLKRRADNNGFAIDKKMIQVDGYQQHRSFKKGGKIPIAFSTLDFSGLLEVTESAKFIKVLKNGVGPAKAFGCGLMLVRRI